MRQVMAHERGASHDRMVCRRGARLGAEHTIPSLVQILPEGLPPVKRPNLQRLPKPREMTKEKSYRELPRHLVPKSTQVGPNRPAMSTNSG